VKSESEVNSEVNCCGKREPMYCERPHIYRQPSPPTIPKQSKQTSQEKQENQANQANQAYLNEHIMYAIQHQFGRANDQEPTGSKHASTQARTKNHTETKQQTKTRTIQQRDQDQTSKHRTVHVNKRGPPWRRTPRSL
jgi:phosphatidate phosphatase PAH1